VERLGLVRAGRGSRTGGRPRLPPLRRTPTAPPSAAGVAGSSRGAPGPVRLVGVLGLHAERGGPEGGEGLCAVWHV